MGLGLSLGIIQYSACWKQTESFGREDLPVLAKVADQAHSFIFQKQQEPE